MKFLCSIVHFLGGALTALVSTKFPVLGLIMAILFIVYEVDEDWHLSDEAFRDILEFTIGLYITSLVVLTLGVLR